MRTRKFSIAIESLRISGGAAPSNLGRHLWRLRGRFVIRASEVSSQPIVFFDSGRGWPSMSVVSLVGSSMRGFLGQRRGWVRRSAALMAGAVFGGTPEAIRAPFRLVGGGDAFCFAPLIPAMWSVTVCVSCGGSAARFPEPGVVFAFTVGALNQLAAFAY